MNSDPEKWHGNKFFGFSLCLLYHRLSAQEVGKQKIPKSIKQKESQQKTVHSSQKQ